MDRKCYAHQKNMKGDLGMKTIMNRKQYIGALKYCLQARNDFNDLEYIADVVGEGEYLVLSDIIGQVCMLNITGYTEAMIYHTLAQIECGAVPINTITDKAEIMRIAKLRR